MQHETEMNAGDDADTTTDIATLIMLNMEKYPRFGEATSYTYLHTDGTSPSRGQNNSTVVDAAGPPRVLREGRVHVRGFLFADSSPNVHFCSCLL